jgi:hypothetical protein
MAEIGDRRGMRNPAVPCTLGTQDWVTPVMGHPVGIEGGQAFDLAVASAAPLYSLHAIPSTPKAKARPIFLPFSSYELSMVSSDISRYPLSPDRVLWVGSQIQFSDRA